MLRRHRRAMVQSRAEIDEAIENIGLALNAPTNNG